MSIWHFKLSLIPEEVLRSKYCVLPSVIASDAAEDSLLWISVEPVEIEKEIDSILPETNSWSDSMRIWGDEHSDSASICYIDEEKKRLEWVEFRIDVRNLSRSFVGAICKLAKELKCLVLTDQYQLIVPNEVAVFAAIDSSIAKRFVEDPISTLRSLKHQQSASE
jgi:hypothetical protein